MRRRDLDQLTRIRQSLAAIAGDALAPPLDAAAASLAKTLERWNGNPMLRRFVGGVQRDVVTSEGEQVELSVSIAPPLRGYDSVRFHVGEHLLGEEAIRGRDEIHIVRRARAVGLHDIRVEILDSSKQTIAWIEGRRVMQVVSGRPVAMVHAELILDDPDKRSVDALKHLSEESFELVYFDIHEKNREQLIDEAVARLRLPRAAIAIYSAEEQELQSLGVDFVRMFASGAIRRLWASGVPVCALLTKRRIPTQETAEAELAVMTPMQALRRTRSGELDPAPDAEALLAQRAQSSSLDWRLDQMTKSKRIGGNSFHAEFDNRKARERLFEAIETAQENIHLQVYIVRPSAFAEQLIVRLVRRAREGVTVRLMVDALYSDTEILGRLNPLIRSLRNEPRIEVLAVKPITSTADVSVERLKKRDHRKLIIVDGVRAIVSGRNFGDEYFTGFDEVPVHDHTPHERIPWLDAQVEVEGPLVASVQATFVDTWHKHGGRKIVSPVRTPEPRGDAAGRFVVHEGFADVNGLAMYEALFDCAEDHAYIVNDFPFVPALERAVFRLLARGVVVKLLTGSASARRSDGTLFPAPVHRTAFEYLVKARLEPLIEAGVEVYEFMPPPAPMVVSRGGRVRPYVHAKLVSIDGRATSIGSANLDGTASFWESEANVVVQDASFAKGVETELERLIQGSARLDLQSEYWERERAQRAVVGTLWPSVLYS